MRSARERLVSKVQDKERAWNLPKVTEILQMSIQSRSVFLNAHTPYEHVQTITILQSQDLQATV